MQSPCGAVALAIGQPAARLAAARIVAHDQRVAIEHHRLQPPVGTGHDAGLLAEVDEIEDHQPCHAQHHQERHRVLPGRTADPLGQGLDAHEVSQEGVGQIDANDQEQGIFGHRAGRRSPVARAVPGPGRAVEQPLDRPENELHVDRLRTHPAAPHAAGQGRRQADPQDQRKQRQGQEQGIRGKEREAEDRELAIGQVQEHRRLALDLQIRQEREDGNQRVGQDPPRPQIGPVRKPRMKPAPRAVFHHRGKNAALGYRRTGTQCLLTWMSHSISLPFWVLRLQHSARAGFSRPRAGGP